MSLTVVSVPIGNPKDVTLRALETLKQSDVVICEEKRPAQTYFKMWDIPHKEILELNEHTKLSEVKELVDICEKKKVALISDVGTPGFCDPGAELVRLCREKGVLIDVNPGASSLMTLLAVSGWDLKEFVFIGFLPAEKGSRIQKIKEMAKESRPVVVMDTPYRLRATLVDLVECFGSRKAVLGIDLTTPNQKILMSSIKGLSLQHFDKAPFVLIIEGRLKYT
jgi:16S rRNA (cytidine1402-2'-O)-methyltransferase